MKTTLYKATEKLIKDPALKRFIIFNLIDVGEDCTILKEGDVVEFSSIGITFCFCWDFITVIDNISNNVVDCTSIETEVKEFIYNYYKGI